MSTIEGGMVCTNDEDIYQMCRMFRSHGMVREMKNETGKQKLCQGKPGIKSRLHISLFPATICATMKSAQSWGGTS